jgi:hypothetical protein
LIINELKKRNMPFLSLTPNESIPIEIKAVITTENEQKQINYEKVLIYREGVEPEALIHEAIQIVQGKGSYDRLIIGIDPGEFSDWQFLQMEKSWKPATAPALRIR